MEGIAAKSGAEMRRLRAPGGTAHSCRGWSQEAALRILMNSLDPEVSWPRAAAVDWPSFDLLVQSLRELGNDETLLVQSGKPSGVFQTQEPAPRVLIFGADPAGSWTRIGPQQILQETYEIFAAAARKHFGGDLAGKLVVTAGMGRMGGVQPLAAAMNGAAVLCIEVDPERIKEWMKAGFCDVMVNSLEEALRILKNAVRKGETASVGLAGNCSEILPELASRGVVPDILTDRTGANDPLNGYIPAGFTPDRAAELRRSNPEEYRKRAMESIARHAEAMLALAKLGSIAFEFGNDFRAMAVEAGVKEASDLADYFGAYVRPLLCQGRAPIRCVALSGEPEDVRRVDQLALDLFGENETLSRWITQARKRVRRQGLPARAFWLGLGEASRFGAAINDLVARAELKAPVVIACDDFGAGLDGTADWPLPDALVGAASGACMISAQNEGLAQIGRQIDKPERFSQAIVADGTEAMGERTGRVLANNSASAIMRCAVAGFPEAVDSARRHGIRIPTLESQGNTRE